MRSFYKSIPSDLSGVDALCLEAHDVLRSNGAATRWFAVDLLLREFVNNAIIHGNKRDPLKRVDIGFRLWDGWVVLAIQDEGRGFNWQERPVCVPDDDADSGRGLVIGFLYARHVRYSRKGTRVTLWIPMHEEDLSE